jgi:hypothetical protein
MKAKLIFLFCFIFSVFLHVPQLKAEPWVDTSNIYLRANIQHLFDLGLIKTPVTTFPLMWADIARDLKKVNYLSLNKTQQSAYNYVKYQLNKAKKNQRILEVNTAIENKRFTSFGESFRNKNNVTVHNTFIYESFAAKLAPSYSNSPSDNESARFDGSYIAAFWGNWVLSAGLQDRWWGPGWDTSLSITNNARPMPTLALSRKSAAPLEIPFTEIEIPWTVTTFMGVMDDKRTINNTLLWGFRLNFMPADNWEIGINRLAQWAGDGRKKGIDIFLDLLAGNDNCGGNGPTVVECANGEEPGNQLAGFDIRYTTQLFSQPFSLYTQMMAEDGNSKNSDLVAQKVWGYGIDTHFNFLNNYWLAYLEYSDSFTDCTPTRAGGKNGIGDCLYEHHTYQTGVRYQGRSIGNIYENDAKTIVLGLVSQADNNINYELKVRWLQLNYDNHDKAPDNPLVGNTLTPIAEDMLMLSAKAQHSYKRWRYTLGTDISQSSFENNVHNDREINLYLNVEYKL